MNRAVPPAPGSLPPTLSKGVLVVCDRFEAAWRAGQQPRIEDYLGETPEPDRPALLHELLALELELRGDRGESPTPQEYRSRFPGHDDLICSVFAEMAPRGETRMPKSTLVPVPQRSAGNGTALPEEFGRYQILQRLGGGAMGTVYLAHDRTLDRRVALKVPVFTAADGPEVFARFLREARAAATLHHPNLCPIHDVGQIDGIHYLTMAYIEGRPLSALLRGDQPPGSRKAAALVRTLARALAEAHRAGVIHRDLKPSNIMITRNGVPVIVDFGLARRLGKGDARLTASGMMLGTPAYMPPEQWQGDVAAMGPGCDIYSLGVIFYELLAGRRPFLGSVAEILGQILFATPQPPSTHRPGIDPRLEAICLKAMAREVADRYASMDALAEALEGYLRDKGPAAPPPSEDLTATESMTAEEAPATPTPPRRPLGALAGLLGIGCVTLVLLSPLLRHWKLNAPSPKGAQTTPSVPASISSSEGAKPTPSVPVSPTTPSASPPVAQTSAPPPKSPATATAEPERRDEEDPEIARLSEIIRHDPENISAYNDRGNAYLDRGMAASNLGQNDRATADYDRAITDYTEVIRRAPPVAVAKAYFNRGIASYQKGEFAAAIADYTEAIQRGSDDRDLADFYTNRGNTYTKTGDFDRAIRDFDEAIRLNSDDFKPYLGRGLAYAKKGDTDRANSDYEQSDRLRSLMAR